MCIVLKWTINSPRANLFPVRGLVWIPGEPREDLICTVPRPHLLDRRLIWPGHFGARSFGNFWIISFKFSKAYWIRFSSWESFIGFHIWGWCPFSTSLACLFPGVYLPLEFKIPWEKLCWKGSDGDWGFTSCLLPWLRLRGYYAPHMCTCILQRH